MENIIKGLTLLPKEVSKETILEMEQAALVQARQANLEFKIIEVKDKNVVIRVSQDKEAEEFYSRDQLIKAVHETFFSFFPGRRILVHPFPYKRPPVDDVDIEWINKKMLHFNIGLKQIVADTGLNKSSLSTLINGGKELSQSMKALFYYYFECKKRMKKS
jgi:hypothetical protein